MKLVNFRKSTIAVVVFGALIASTCANAATTPASDVQLSTGMDIETAHNNLQGQVDGLSNDVFTNIQDIQTQHQWNQNESDARRAADDANNDHIVAVEQDLNSTKNGVVVVNDKVDALDAKTDREIQAANDYTSQVQAQSNAADAMQDNRLTTLENQPKPKDGVDGKNGKDGAKGDKGDTGATGKDGVTTTITKVDTATQKKVTDNSTAISGVRKQSDSVAKDLDAAKQFFSQQASNNTKRINNIQDQQNEDRKEYRSGIAGAASIAGLHYVDTDNAVAIGAADYKSEQGYALGYRHKFAENVAATVSYAGTSNGDSVVAASASLGW